MLPKWFWHAAKCPNQCSTSISREKFLWYLFKKWFFRKEVEECTVEDSASEQKAAKYKREMYAIGCRGVLHPIQTTTSLCVRVCMCVRATETDRDRQRDREKEYVCMWPLLKVCCCHLLPFEKPSFKLLSMLPYWIMDAKYVLILFYNFQCQWQ